MKNNVKIVYVYELMDGKFGVYIKKEIVNNSIVLTHLYTMDVNTIYHMPLTGCNIIINLDMITGNNVMYVNMNNLGNQSVYEYIHDRVFSKVR